jgi:hypothetical protein
MAEGIKTSYEYEERLGSDTEASPLKTTSNGVILIPQPSEDPRDPLNWSMTKKIATLAIVSFASCINLAQSIANQASFVPQAALYHVQPVEVSYSVSQLTLIVVFQLEP